MTPSKFAEYKKAIGGFVGTAIPLVGAIVAANVLNGDAAHYAAIVLAGLTAIGGPLGVALAPKNGPKTTVLVDDVRALLANATEIHQVLAEAGAELERVQHPLLPLPATVDPSHVVGGVVEAPSTAPLELEPAGSEGS